jgi:hypothetical protein
VCVCMCFVAVYVGERCTEYRCEWSCMCSIASVGRKVATTSAVFDESCIFIMYVIADSSESVSLKER